MRAADITSVLPGLHLVASLLKRWVIGTLHHGIDGQQLPYYLDEFTFRFNLATPAPVACCSTHSFNKRLLPTHSPSRT